MNEENFIIINNYLEHLKLLEENFIGIKEQKQIFNEIINELRKLYRKSPKLFSREMIKGINNIKAVINETEVKYFDHTIDRTRKLPIGTNGLLVMHKKLYYVGTVDIFNTQGVNYCITLQNKEQKYVNENEIYVIGIIKESYKKSYEEDPPIGIPEKQKIEKPNIQIPYKEVPILPEGCCSCRYRSECVRKAHAEGCCNEYKRGPAVLCYSDFTEQV